MVVEMDDIEKRVLSQLRSRLIKEVVVTESFLCAFCDNNVMDEQLSKLLKTENNYEQRAAKLLDLLPNRGSKSFLTLMEILEITNPWLAEKMKTALHEERNKDAKINLHPTMSKNATIEGYGQMRLHIDTDVKERASRFVKTNMNHLTEIEQRGVEKWLADELQRERRRQQFRAPHNVPRNTSDFHASKETQTDTSNMDLIELHEEMSIYLHGVDYVAMSVDFSFEKLSHQLTELITRTRKLDALFLNCLEKFDDPDKYSLPLTELIDRALSKEKNLSQVNMNDKRLIQKYMEERDSARRQVKRLEDELDRVLQRQTPTQNPQEIQLRNRQNINARYSLLVPDPGQQYTDTTIRHTANDTSSIVPPSNGLLTNGPKFDINNGNSIVKDSTTVNKNSVNVHYISGSDYANTSTSHDFNKGHLTNGRNEDGYDYAYHQPNQKQNPYQYLNSTQLNLTPNGRQEVEINVPKVSIRRHASEESLKIAISRQEAESTSMSYLGHDGTRPQRRSSQDYESQPYQPNNTRHTTPIQQPKTQQKNSRQDIQNKMMRMLAGASTSSKPTQPVRRSESEKAVATHGVQTVKNSKSQETSSVFKGNPSLRASYDNIAAASTKNLYQNYDNTNHVMTNTSLPNQQQQANPYRYIMQTSTVQHQYNDQNSRGQHQSRQEQFQKQLYQKQVENPYTALDEVDLKREVYGTHEYRDSKTSMIYPKDTPISLIEQKTRFVSPNRSQPSDDAGYPSHQPRPPSRQGPRHTANVDYMSDSEAVIGSGQRKTTSSPERTKNRVRFASPVSRSSKPTKKSKGGKLSHYQQETASALNRKSKKTLV